MLFKVIPPPSVLKPYVRYFWTVDYDGTNCFRQEINTVVDDSSGIVFHHHNGRSCFLNEDNDRVKVGLLYGKRTTPSKSISDMPFSATGINFSSQSIKLLFGIDANELTDKMIDLDNLYEGNIVDQLMDQNCQTDRIKLLTNFLISKINNKHEIDQIVLNCCARIRAGSFNVHVSHLSKAYGISERQLERRFKQTVGLSPKLFMRITKFQKAMTGIMSGNYKNFSEIVYDLGYSDQSRFISDIKEFTNYTPKQILQNMKRILLLDER